ncbi:MAG: glucosaminidase domain-containing protein [Clostridium sp.]|nr:glucosaminidase domain-containing protein [Clostridium sp.]
MATKFFSNPVILKVLAGLGAVVIALSLIASIFIGFISIFIGENSDIDLAVPNEEQRAFILKLVPIAQDNYNEYGIFPSVTIAQAIHESAWGKSDLSVQANNLFGVKADENWKGETIEMPTKEYINGEEIIVIAKWRKYASFEDSIRDHGKFLKENSRYENAGVFKAKDYKEQAYAIRMAGYATDPQYASLICNIIESYSLNIYDFKVGEGNKVVERAITTGMSIVGKSPYVFGGGRNPQDIAALKFDCSSFVHWCYANGGLNLGDYKSVVTFSLVTMGKEIAPEDMKRGDLIFFNTEGVANNHVGIYLGDNKFLHDAEPNGVWINSLDEGYWKNAFNGNVRRVVE